MKAGAVTVLGGLSVIAAVAALYFWPSSLGARCPALIMTEQQINAAEDITREELLAAFSAASERSTCLMRDVDALLIHHLPEPLHEAETVMRAPFQSDDIRQYMELARPADAAALAAMRRDTELFGAQDAAQEAN